MKASTSNIKKTISTILKKQAKGKSWIIDELVSNLDKDDNRIIIKDCSKGCDNLVYIVSLSNKEEEGEEEYYEDNKIVVRIPKHLENEDCPFMHRPLMQAKILNIMNSIGLEEINIKVAKLIALDPNDKYMIESYVPSKDLSELFSVPFKMNDKQIKNVFSKIGSILNKIHTSTSSIVNNNNGVGYIKNIELQGTFENWNQFFEDDYMSQLETMEIKIELMNGDSNFKFKDRDEVKEYLKHIYLNDGIKQYLLEFSKCTLVHADLCSNNIRVENKEVREEEDVDVKVTGIIDFADCIIGDPLYDFGRILSHVYGDFRFIEAMERTYLNGDEGNGNEQFTNTQCKMILFYSLYFCGWLLDVSDTKEDILKYNQILSSLLTLYKNKIK